MNQAPLWAVWVNRKLKRKRNKKTPADGSFSLGIEELGVVDTEESYVMVWGGGGGQSLFLVQKLVIIIVVRVMSI